MIERVQDPPTAESMAWATAYIGRKYQQPTGQTEPQVSGSGQIEQWHAVRVVNGRAARQPVCLKGSGTLEAPFFEWEDAAIAASRCSNCVAQVSDEVAHPPGTEPDDWMYYVAGATLADLRLETDADGSPSWGLWYRLDPRGLLDGEVPTPVHRAVVPPAPLGQHDGAALSAAVHEALCTRYSVTKEDDDSPGVVAAWRLAPL
jgi:hypothetical protein